MEDFKQSFTQDLNEIQERIDAIPEADDNLDLNRKINFNSSISTDTGLGSHQFTTPTTAPSNTTPLSSAKERRAALLNERFQKGKGKFELLDEEDNYTVPRSFQKAYQNGDFAFERNVTSLSKLIKDLKVYLPVESRVLYIGNQPPPTGGRR